MMDITWIGTIGALLILGAFVAAQTHKLKDTDRMYDGINLLGSALLMYYAFSISSTPFIVINGAWFLVSLRDLFSSIKKKKKKV
jgi:lipid-A-disaccharide synthase-like uncharacterized protein